MFASSHSLSSRIALRTLSLVFMASATGCVAAKDYDQARSVAESEVHAHQKTRDRLEAALARINTLEAELAQRQESLETNASAAEESKLATTVATKEKDAAMQLVEELRSELARTGDHLVLFAQEKRNLQQTLLVTEERMRDIELAGKNLSELVATTRDLTLALEPELEQQRLELGARDGQVVVSLPSERLFAASDMLALDAGPLIAAIAGVSAKHSSLRVVVREPTTLAGASVRVARLGDALRQNGVADARLVLPSAPEAAPPQAIPAAAEAGSGAADGAPAASAEPKKPKEATGPASNAAPKYEIAFAP